MSEQDTGAERTEEPTAKRLKESHDEGQIARSKDFNTALALALAAIGLMALGGTMGSNLADHMGQSLTIEREHLMDKTFVVTAFWQQILDAILVIAPFLFVTVIAAFIGPVLLGGWSFSTKAMSPKFSKLNPFAGLKRMFGMNALVELLKAVLKVILLGIIAYLTFKASMNEFLQLGQNSIQQGLIHASEMILWQMLALVAGLFVVAGIDAPYQLYTHKKKLMMTRQQVKDESKETDGRPEIKMRIRQLQYEMANNRMMKDIPNADVILVNPTHYAVALRYDTENDAAPILVAKGTDLIAFKIREIGEAHNIAIFSAPPLTRALYFTTEIGRPIPKDLYLAVARVLAYLHQLNNLKRGSRPVAPSESDLPIPDGYKDLTRKQPKRKRTKD